MLSILMAVSAATSPVPADVVALGPCAPHKHAACDFDRPAATRSLPLGKRCHSDPTRSIGCREVSPAQELALREQARRVAVAEAK